MDDNPVPSVVPTGIHKYGIEIGVPRNSVVPLGLGYPSTSVVMRGISPSSVDVGHASSAIKVSGPNLMDNTVR